MWLIGIVAIIGLVIVALVLKQTNSSSAEKDGYDTYTVEKENPLNLEEKHHPMQLKHITTTVN